MKRLLVGALLTWTLTLPAAGEGLNNVLRNGPGTGPVLEKALALPGGITGDLSVIFEGVTGLSLPNLGLTTVLVSPSDPGLLSRLPGTTSLPALFPVLMRIEPTLAGGLAFTGVAGVQLDSLILPAPPGANWRLYAAPTGAGSFKDITASLVKVLDLGSLGGSYRLLGSRGGFSEFVVVNDQTPLNLVIATKLDRLDQALTGNAAAISSPVYALLAAGLTDVRSQAAAGNDAAALAGLEVFLSTVMQYSGTDIPDVWRSARDLTNVAGLLRAEGETLRFSLRQRRDLGQ